MWCNSSLTSTQSYVVRATNGATFLLKAAPSTPSDHPTYSPNTLDFEYTLAQQMSKCQDIPQPNLIAFDPSLATVPYPYILSAHPASGISLAQAHASNKLTERQILLLDLRLGSHFKRIHDEVQNDWFGLPSQEKDELYSWQEAFTSILETVLQDARDLGETLPYEEIRKYLSRAIGFFLFDDCEVPSLISFLGDEESIRVDFDPESPTQDEEIPITSVFSLSHALWGDPLLETVLLDPSPAFLEGYGGSPIIFARQKTKRMWYTLLQALVVLVQSHRSSGVDASRVDVKRGWAREKVAQCVQALANAPCY
ncbi:hypothetical protein EUX98_g3432 [Antrodiella citrinella]|uniref:Aminoglycoside phosphotransferase domain-containing protein n=1 Tax=Antrodiella citrinella TaxID=2447956 RepID=A0A4S4MWJ2_9APHY|nr:hypothetical protein EUX98_g3432 [Antrodiella citrinella]